MSLDMLFIDCNCILKDDLNGSRFYGIKKAHIEQEKEFQLVKAKSSCHTEVSAYHTFLLATELAWKIKIE
jgi:hypothetical protein